MEALRVVVAMHGGLAAGIITDEVQAITKAVGKGESAVTVPRQLAADYFSSRWHNWDNKQGVFARMSIASSHGARELKLPSGEERRLRIVQPLPPGLIKVLQADTSSPAFIADEQLRVHVAFIAGGVLRRLVFGADLARGKRNSKEVRELIWHDLWVPMAEDCSRWLSAIPAGTDRLAAAESALGLVRGELTWSRAKPLYDDGLVARMESYYFVVPVSPVAAAVILHTVAAEVRGGGVSLSSKRAGAERGFELERQLLARLTSFATTVPANLLDGTPTASLQLRADYALPFKVLHEVLPRDEPVAYVPLNPNFACDVVMMPAADDAASPIILLEPSTTDPLDPDRVKKVRKWFEPEGVVTMLRAVYPKRQVVCALVWDQALRSRALSDSAAELARAASARTADGAAADAIVVIDLKGIVQLHIVP